MVGSGSTPAIGNDRAPVVDELERLVADWRPRIRRSRRQPGDQVIEGLGELRVGGVLATCRV